MSRGSKYYTTSNPAGAVKLPGTARGRVLCIVNPEAGRRAMDRWRGFAAELGRQGFSLTQAVTAGAGDALSLARQRSGGCDVIVAVGGDGTVFEVINGMLAGGRPQAALAIVPFGTGNDIASAAGIHSGAEALRVLTAGTRRTIDLIEVQCVVNGAAVVRHAMLFASVGITSELLKHTTPGLKRLCGRRLAYIAGLLFALRRYSTPLMRITCDGWTVQNRFVFACASNGETFGGGMKIAPGARLDDGKLNVNLIEAVGPWEALRQVPRLFRGRHTNHPKVCYKTALTVAIETETAIEVAADGDLIGHTPARFQVRPQALEVLVP